MQDEISGIATTPGAPKPGRSVEELRQLLSRIDAAHDAQRQNLARELHHKVVGTLSAVKMECDWLMRPQPAEDALRPRLQRLSEQLGETIEFTRRLIGELWPAMVGHLGLASAVQQLVADMKSQTGAAMELAIEGDVDDIPGPVAVALYRFIQEVLEQDPGAQPRDGRVHIDLRRSAAGVELRIEHDATALAEDLLLLLQERATRLGGELTGGESQRGGSYLNVVLPAGT